MTERETVQIMDILRIAYPQFYACRNAPDPKKAISLWAGMFVDDDFLVVAAAIKALIAADASSFPPTIGQVKARIQQITNPAEMTEAEAWALVKRALRNSTYGAKDEFDRLPVTVQRLVGDPEQLREWATMDTETLDSVVASNFQRSFRNRAKQIAEYQSLPADIKAMIGGTSDRLALENSEP